MQAERLHVGSVVRSLLAVVVIGGLAIWMLRDQVGLAHRDVRVQVTVKTLALGLERHWVNQQSYPAPSGPSAAELVLELLAAGYLEQAPMNPYTRAAYVASDAAGAKIHYTVTEDARGYVLIAEKPESTEIAMRVEKHHPAPAND